MSDPFDSLVPIGEKSARRTPREDSPAARRHDAGTGKAAAVAAEAADEPQIPAPPLAELERELTHTDAQRMVASTARRAIRVIESPTAKDGDKKHAAVSLGIALDKWLALSSRPARPEAAADADAMREGAVALALRLAEAVAGRPTITAPVTMNGTLARR